MLDGNVVASQEGSMRGCLRIIDGRNRITAVLSRPASIAA